MPWASVQQARWGHSPSGMKALGPAKVAEFDAATPKGNLPRRAGKNQHGAAARRLAAARMRGKR